MNLTKGIKNIIFDFGGVIINIDYLLTRDAFIKLGITNFDEIYNQLKQNPVFDKFETGEIEEDEFFVALEKLSPPNIERSALISAWNAMLLDFPIENYDFLKQIKGKYRTFLLSNTNETHLDFYFKKLKDWYSIENMDPLFEKTYYSCRVKLRKPNVEIFECVLDDMGLSPEETLFIDDSPQHVEGAKKAGLRAHHLVGKEGIIDLLKS